ncbi:MAG: 4Fe-4S dicluster domain-containing protein [Campylobacter sp.]|nr:4Fe-4S dicluster domain-containing protein [Campylobacter sp.]
MKKTMVIDIDKCIGCFSCEIACKMENGLDLGVYYNKVLTIGPMGVFPDISQYHLPTICQQCYNPTCVGVCPTGSSFVDSEGIVKVDKELCIGCKYCIMACPYGARSYNHKQKVVEKCTVCEHLLAIGEEPACVKVCCAECRIFGDIDDPNSKAAQALAEAGEANIHTLPDRGNIPSAKYILHRKTAQWQEIPPMDTWRTPHHTGKEK